jgi:hypothetical protein
VRQGTSRGWVRGPPKGACSRSRAVATLWLAIEVLSGPWAATTSCFVSTDLKLPKLHGLGEHTASRLPIIIDLVCYFLFCAARLAAALHYALVRQAWAALWPRLVEPVPWWLDLVPLVLGAFIFQRSSKTRLTCFPSIIH